MLLAEIDLVRDNDDTWMAEDGYNFACPEEFDPLFKLSLSDIACTLLVYDSPEEDCIRIEVVGIIEEDEDEQPMTDDFDLFCGGECLTANGTYGYLRRKLYELYEKDSKDARTIWVKLA